MNDTSTAISNTYHLGLAMAGAVSAGAYTAGVLDYLFETLERWEAEKIKGGVPTHKVVLDIMGGASAGGMCAANFGWKMMAYPLIEIAVLFLPGFILKKIYKDLKEIGVIK